MFALFVSQQVKCFVLNSVAFSAICTVILIPSKTSKHPVIIALNSLLNVGELLANSNFQSCSVYLYILGVTRNLVKCYNLLKKQVVKIFCPSHKCLTA